MVSFTDVMTAKPEALTTLAGAWEKVSEKFNAQSRSLDKVTDKLNDGTMDGQSVKAAGGRARGLGKNIGHGVKEAASLHDSITKHAGTIKGIQQELKAVVAKAKAYEGMAFDDATGHASFPIPAGLSKIERNPDDELYKALKKAVEDGKAQAQRFNEEIEEIVKRATAADTAFAADLTLVSELDSSADASFNPDAGKDREDARSRKDATDARELLGKAGDRQLTPAEQARLIELLARRRGDKLFAATLIEQLSPRELLQYTGNIAINDPSDHEDLNAFQKYMGEALGTASQNWTAAERDHWLGELEKLGNGSVAVTEWADGDSHPGRDLKKSYSGHLMLAPLLEHGSFDRTFLSQVADDMMPGNREGGWATFTVADHESFMSYDKDNPFTAKSGDLNPLNSALIGLGNNPEAATDFYNIDGNPALEGHQSNLQVLFSEPGVGVTNLHGDLDPKVLGNSLEAATTGKDFDGPSDGDRGHTKDQLAVTSNMIRHFGNYPELIGGADAHFKDINGNLANISSDYIVDIHKTMDGHEVIKGLGDPKDVLSASEKETSDFLRALGQDREAYAQVAASSSTLLKLEMAAALSDGNTEGVPGSTQPHAETMAGLSAGKMDAIESSHWQQQAAADTRNSYVDFVKNGVDIVVGEVGAGKALDNPVFQAADITPDRITEEIANLFKDNTDYLDEAKVKMDEWRATAGKDIEDVFVRDVRQAMENAKIPDHEQDEFIADWVETGAILDKHATALEEVFNDFRHRANK